MITEGPVFDSPQFQCERQPPAFPTISAQSVFDFLGDCMVWFYYANPEGATCVSSFAVFRNRVEFLYTHRGVVFLKLKPLYVDAQGEQIAGEPCVDDVMDSLQLGEPIDLLRVFRMYNYIESEDVVEKAECCEMSGFVTREEFEKFFRGFEDIDAAWDKLRNAREGASLC